MKTLFVTASNHILANYHTVWHLYQNKTDIEQIVIITTDFSKHKNPFAKNLKELLLYSIQFDNAPIIQELYIPDEIADTDCYQIEQVLLEWIHQNNPKRVIFNVTGGTKMMSIAQDHIAHRFANMECLYQNTKGEITWYMRANQKKTYQITPASDISIYLQAYGYQLDGDVTPIDKLGNAKLSYVEAMLEMMDEKFDKLQRFVSCLNFHGAVKDKKKGENFPHSSTFNANDSKYYAKWLEKLSNLENPIFDYDKGSKTITWQDKDSLEFTTGGWFEVMIGFRCYQLLLQRNPRVSLKDVHVSLHFKKNNSPNEADVCFIHNGHFYFVECKTKKWNGETTTANKDISHLDSSAKVGGLNCHKFFVSLYEVTGKTKQTAKNRDVNIIAGRKVKNLEVLNQLLSSQPK